MNSSTKKELPKQELFFEKVLAAFSTKFSSPTSDILSTKCISKSLLLKHLLSIRDEIAFPGYRRISSRDILFHLERSKIIHPITTLEPDTKLDQKKFYLLGLTSKESVVDPIELLQALEPKGVICYFTALEFYGLTTQLPSHHHVAKLVPALLKEENINEYKTFSPMKGRTFDSLGSKKFIYEDTPFYITNRGVNLVPGIKERFLDEKTRFRITTLEQTLLDTLHKPLSCGGSSVVFEVWQNAIDKINSDVIFEYLKKINSNGLSRRTGYMLQIMDYSVNSDLIDFLNSVKSLIKRNKSENAISLLPGLDYHHINEEWFIRTP